MRRKPSRTGHPRFGAARLVLVLLLAGLVLAAAGGLAGCLFQPVISSRGTMLFLPGA